jgi:hypothetical protein
MQDKSSYTSNNKPQISEILQNFINAMVEEIVLKGEAFDEQKKKWLKKYSEAEGLNYAELEGNLNDFFELLPECLTTNTPAVKRIIEEKAIACFIGENVINNILKKDYLVKPENNTIDTIRIFNVQIDKRSLYKHFVYFFIFGLAIEVHWSYFVNIFDNVSSYLFLFGTLPLFFITATVLSNFHIIKSKLFLNLFFLCISFFSVYFFLFIFEELRSDFSLLIFGGIISSTYAVILKSPNKWLNILLIIFFSYFLSSLENEIPYIFFLIFLLYGISLGIRIVKTK